MSSDEFRMKFKKKFWKMIILHSIVVVRLYSSPDQILSGLFNLNQLYCFILQ